MITKQFSIAILLIVAISSVFSTCRKGGLGCANTIYNFRISTQAYPDKDSISIGDTIWISLDEPTIFTDLLSGEEIDYNMAANLGFGLTFDKFIGGSFSNPGTESAVKSFSYNLIEGSEIESLQPERIKSFTFLEISGKYKFKIAIIPHQQGIFSISISNAANVFRENDKCTKASFKIDFENTNQHLYLYQNNRPEYEISDYEKKHMYCFKVY
jgi:hypothetical protein